ncbi:MAG TPA: CDP-alcohol phosphatidyltransferase family protein, partial [Polyangia bacterium]
MAERAAIDRVCIAIGALGLCGLGAVAAVLPAAQGMVGRFFLGAAVAWALTVRNLWLHRQDAGAESSGASARAYAGLGAATGVTLFRAWLVAIVAGHLFLDPADGRDGFVVGIIYSVAAILDGVDGRIARGSAQVTRLGSRL